MLSRWRDADAREAIEGYAKVGVGEDLALRTYSTRLLGGDPLLVLHGGGNTSVKTQLDGPVGRDASRCLCVKGSGWDMASIEPAGLPAVKLEPLRKLRRLDRLADEDMVNFQRTNLLNPSAPNPSVETLLHAFLPHKFIDHTHAAAVLSLVDQPNGRGVGRGRLRRQHGLRALCHSGLRPRQAGGRGLRGQARRRRADPRTSTAFSPSERARARPTSA